MVLPLTFCLLPGFLLWIYAVAQQWFGGTPAEVRKSYFSTGVIVLSNRSSVPPQPVEDGEISVPRLIGVGLATRLIVDTSVKVFFPFLPVIAQGLGVSEISVSRLVSLRSATGLTSPLFGMLADRRGYRYTMRLGLFLAAIGYLVIGLSTALWMTAVGMMIAGIGTFSFAPTIQAYLSTRLPYHRRARGLGVLEYAWALASIVGLFLVGLLIAATNWRIPFFVFAGALFTAGVLYRYLPAAPTGAKQTPPLGFSRAGAEAFFDLGPNVRSAVAVIGCNTLMMFAALNLFINYGTWLSREYALGAALLGTVELVMGFADLSGSVVVSVISDWLGKRRSVIVGAGISAVFFGLMPVFNVGVVLAVVGIVLARSTFEFAIVSNMTLLSEQAPENRAKALTFGAAASMIGGTAAGFTGASVYEVYGVAGLALLSAVPMALASLICWWRVTEEAGE